MCAYIRRVKSLLHARNMVQSNPCCLEVRAHDAVADELHPPDVTPRNAKNRGHLREAFWTLRSGVLGFRALDVKGCRE